MVKETATKNIGEWSEFYAFLYVLSEGELLIADENLENKDGQKIVFDSISRTEEDGTAYTYKITKNIVVIYDNIGSILTEIPRAVLKLEANSLYKKIIKNSRTEPVLPEDFPIREKLFCTKISANSLTKNDMQANVIDRASGVPRLQGFSIKSRIGGAPTYLNTSKNSTRFIYKILNFKEGVIDEINTLFELDNHGDIKKSKSGNAKIPVGARVRKILELGGILEFVGTYNKKFEQNLRMIDSLMPEFIAEGLKEFHSGSAFTFEEFASFLSTADMFSHLNLPPSAYKYKLQNLISASNLGMKPARIWDGRSEAHGGYIVIKKNGDVLCYSLQDQDAYKTHLFKRTKFESPSANRHDYAYVYKKDMDFYFDLQPQFREK